MVQHLFPARTILGPRVFAMIVQRERSSKFERKRKRQYHIEYPEYRAKGQKRAARNTLYLYNINQSTGDGSFTPGFQDTLLQYSVALALALLPHLSKGHLWGALLNFYSFVIFAVEAIGLSSTLA